MENNSQGIEGHQPSESQQLYRVAVKLPPFWPEKPELWFAQVDAQFLLSNITKDDTKYHYVIAQLDHKFAQEVEDIIINPPATGKYDKLKSELINRISISREQRVRQLLTQEEMGDRKPSQFMRHLKSLAGTSVPDELIRSLWANRLPQHVQTIIASQTKANLDSVAELADRICEISIEPKVQAVNLPTNNDNLLIKKINQLTEQVAELHSQVYRNQSRQTERGRFRSGARYRSRERSYSRTRYNPNSKICWYHQAYGTKARKCTLPCNFDKGNETNSQ